MFNIRSSASSELDNIIYTLKETKEGIEKVFECLNISIVSAEGALVRDIVCYMVINRKTKIDKKLLEMFAIKYNFKTKNIYAPLARFFKKHYQKIYFACGMENQNYCHKNAFWD